MGQFQPRLGDVEKPPVDHRGFPHSAYSAYLWAIKRAGERTRTADLLITSVRSVVAESCRGLQIPHRQRVYCSLYCPLLHGIAPGLGSN
jgi:hypothetical protein